MSRTRRAHDILSTRLDDHVAATDQPLAKAVRLALQDVHSWGPGDHVHLDEVLGALAPPRGDARWVGLARQVAAVLAELPGRFIITVPLESSRNFSLPETTADIQGISRLEPPAIYPLPDQNVRRTWVGEYFRLDLVEETPEMLVYVSAGRTPEERAHGEPFDVCLHFET